MGRGFHEDGLVSAMRVATRKAALTPISNDRGAFVCWKAAYPLSRDDPFARSQSVSRAHAAAREYVQLRRFYIVVPAGELSVPRRLGLFSIDRANLFGLRTRDYGDGKSTPLAWIRNVLKQWRIDEADGEVLLMTLPRLFGYAFNPVSFWLCHDREGQLRAVLAEVSNTFGERHSYLCFHDDHGPIVPDDTLSSRKVFHVSPFMSIDGEYRFRFSAHSGRIAVCIDLVNDGKTVLRTAVAGSPVPLSSLRLLSAMLRNPLQPLKVIGLIHYQAVKLFLKGFRHFHKPEPPSAAITR